MKRRDFIKTATVGSAAGVALAGCSPQGNEPRHEVVSGPRIVWRLASSFPPGLDTIFGASEVLSRRVGELTGGAFTIHVSGAGEIVPALQVLDAVQQGTVQMGHTAGYYYIGKNPAFVFDTSVPFGLTARQQMAWMHHGGGIDLLRAVYSDFNIINFPGGNTGAQMGGWFRREINTVGDLKGLKMRIPGFGGKVMDRLGVSVQVLAGGEIYPALERGAIDATEWVGPYDDEKLGFHNVAKFYYYPGWWEPGPALSFLVNKDAWSKLPSTYQAVVEVAAKDAGLTMTSLYDARNPAALERLLRQGVQLRRFSDGIMIASKQESDDLGESISSTDAAYRTIYQSWKTFRNKSTLWFGTAELAFMQFVANLR